MNYTFENRLILNLPAVLAFMIYVYPNKFYLREFKLKECFTLRDIRYMKVGEKKL